MEYFVTFAEDHILVRFRIEGGDFLADCMDEIHPGESFYYLSYEELLTAGEGRFELDTARLEE